MAARTEGDTIYFSSGRTAYAHVGIVGLSPNLVPLQGYDGDFVWPGGANWSDEDREERGTFPDDLTADDMRELADMMIERWQRFRASLDEVKP